MNPSSPRGVGAVHESDSGIVLTQGYSTYIYNVIYRRVASSPSLSDGLPTVDDRSASRVQAADDQPARAHAERRVADRALRRPDGDPCVAHACDAHASPAQAPVAMLREADRGEQINQN